MEGETTARFGTKYTKRYFFLVLTLAVLISLPVAAQTSLPPTGSAFLDASSSTPDGDQREDAVLTIKKRVDEVNLLFIATDKHGKFVRDLNQTDFAILDDHKPPQSIVNFRSETDLPLELGLLIDTSGSVRTRFDFEQQSAIDFLQQTLRPHFDKAFVMGFSSHSTVTQDFTDDNVLLRIGVHRLQNGGGTALYDAIYRACKNKLMKEQEDRP